MSAFTLLNLAAIPAAGTVAGSAMTFGKPSQRFGAQKLLLQGKFTYGSGGTSFDAYVQSSADEGLTFYDVAHFSFTTANKTRLLTIADATSVLVAATPTDAGLAADTALAGLLGSMLRVKTVTVGTYAASTFVLTGVLN